MSSKTLSCTRAQSSMVTRDFYHISFASECQRCFNTCVKPRRLPCEHEFCKSCLKDYFNKEIEDLFAVNTFPCPACDTPVEKPLMAKSKWTKAFKIDKTSLFYTERPSSASLSHDRKHSQLLTYFNCKINTEQNPCAFWGGDVCVSGDVVLPDMYNHTIKVFTERGKLITSTKLSTPPLDVTSLPEHGLMVASFGSARKSAKILTFTNGRFYNSQTVALQGHLYNTTRLGNRCMGILEFDDRLVTLATVSAKGTVRNLDIGEISACLSSASCIYYDKAVKQIYLTEKTNFICLNSGGKLKFEKSYPFGESDHYRLGSITCDQETIYIVSDSCILCTDKNGNYRRTIRTSVDPFHILISNDNKQLYIVGRNDKVEIHLLGFDF